MTGSVLIHEEGRKASWFELFFDLVFVTGVAGLAGRFATDYGVIGALEFTFLFLVLWWLWLGHTFLASRFDRDRPDQWAIGFAQMLAVVFIAYGAGDAFGDRAWAFAGGVAVVKALLMVGYLREAGRPGLARLCRLYGAIYGAQAALWAVSLALPDEARVACWALALALDFASPFLVARETFRAPPHPEHLPERFGLFTLILLGETAAAAVHALDHGTELHGETLVVAICGALLGFLFWVGYFRRARGQAERHVGDAAAGRRLRLWAFSHIPLYLGIAGIGAGTVYLGHHAELHGAEAWLYSGGAAVGMVGVTLVSLATAGRPLVAGWPYFLVALVAALLPLALHDAVPMALALVVLAAAQVGLSVLRSRPA